MWNGNHTNRHIIGFVWLPILRYVEILHTRLCTTVITPKTHFSLFSYNIEIVLIFILIMFFIKSHTCHLWQCMFTNFCFMVRSRVILKCHFFLVCLWAIDRTSHMLILFAVLLSLFEPLREWLIFFKVGVET